MAKVGIFPIHLDPPTVEHRLLFRLLLGQQLYDNPTLEKRVWEIPTPYAHSPQTSLHHLGAEKYDTSTLSGISPTRMSHRPECTSSNASVSSSSSQPFSGTSSIGHSSLLASRRSPAVSHSFGQEERMHDADPTVSFSSRLSDPSSLPSMADGREADGSGGNPHGSFSSSLPHAETATPAPDRLFSRRETMPRRNEKESPTAGRASPSGKKRRCLLPREIRHDLGYMDDFSTNISTFSQLVPFDELILIPSTKFPLSLSQSVNLAALTVLGTSGIPHLHIDFTALEHPDETMPIVYQLVRHYPRGTVIHWLHDAYEMRSWLNFDWIKQTVPLLLLNTKSVTSSTANASTTDEAASEGWGGWTPSSPSSRSHGNGKPPREGDQVKDKEEDKGTPPPDAAGSGTKESSTKRTDEASRLGDTASRHPFSPISSSAFTVEGDRSPSIAAGTQVQQETEAHKEEEEHQNTTSRAGMSRAAAAPSRSGTTTAKRTRWWRAPPASASSSEPLSDVVEVSKWYRGPLESSWLGGHPTQTPVGGGPLPPALGGVRGGQDPLPAASTAKGSSSSSSPSLTTSSRPPPPAPSHPPTSAEESRSGSPPDAPPTHSSSSLQFPAEERHTRFRTPPLSQETAPHDKDEGDSLSPLHSDAHRRSPPTSSGTHAPDFMMEEDVEWMQQAMQLEAALSPATTTAPSPSPGWSATPRSPSLGSPTPTAARTASPLATSHTSGVQEAGVDASLPPFSPPHSPVTTMAGGGQADPRRTPNGPPHGSSVSPPLFSSAPLDTPGMRTSPLEVGQLLRELYPTLWSIPPAVSGEEKGEQRGLRPHLHGAPWGGKGAAVPFSHRRGRRTPPLASVAPLAGGEVPSPPSPSTADAAASTPAVDSSASREAMALQRHAPPSPAQDGSDTSEEKEMVEELGEVEEMEEEGEGKDVHRFTSTSSFPYVEVFGVARHSGAEVRHLLWDQLADEARFLLTKTVWKYITTHGLYHNERRWSAAVTAVSGVSNGASSSFTSPMENDGRGPGDRFRNGIGSNAEVEDNGLPEEAKMSRGYFSFQHLHRRKKPFRAALRNNKILHISGLVPRLELHCDKNNPLARECCDGLNTFACPPGEQPDLIVPIGGDGYMMTCIREHWRRFIPFYGINAGHVGHLLNSPSQLHELFSFPINLHTAIMLYCQCEQPPPKGSPPGTPPKIVSELAFNDAWVERSSGQTAHIRIFVNGVERIRSLKGDGVLLSTAAGSTAYSRALGASPVPIDAPLIQIVGSNVVSPVQWRPAHLEQEDEVELVVLDGDKRPCRCFVDAVEVGNVQRMLVRSSHVAGITLAYSKSCDLQSKLYDLQFPGSRSTSSNG